MQIIQSADPGTVTFKCPKCGAIWRAKSQYNYDFGGHYYDDKGEYCPRQCFNFLGFRIKGKISR